MWGFEYIVVNRVTGWFGELPDRVIIEVRPEEAASDRFWGAYDRALSSA
jgi:hypothetical protein